MASTKSSALCRKVLIVGPDLLGGTRVASIGQGRNGAVLLNTLPKRSNSTCSTRTRSGWKGVT
jgi:hypothetical protein